MPNNSPSPLYSSFHLKIRRIVLFVICSPNAGTLVLALSIPNIVKHGLLHYMSVIVDKVTWWAGVDMGNSACIHHSTLQLQQSAVTMLLILTAGGGEMYRVATLPGGHIQLAELSSHWSRDFNGELWLDRIPSLPGSGSVSIIIMSAVWIVLPGPGMDIINQL